MTEVVFAILHFILIHAANDALPSLTSCLFMVRSPTMTDDDCNHGLCVMTSLFILNLD